MWSFNLLYVHVERKKKIYWYLLARFVFRSSWLILNLVERLWRKKNHTHIQDLQIPKIRPPLLLHPAFSTYLCRPPLLTLPPEPVQFNHGTNVHISEHEVEIYLVAHKILKASQASLRKYQLIQQIDRIGHERKRGAFLFIV